MQDDISSEGPVSETGTSQSSNVGIAENVGPEITIENPKSTILSAPPKERERGFLERLSERITGDFNDNRSVLNLRERSSARDPSLQVDSTQSGIEQVNQSNHLDGSYVDRMHNAQRNSLSADAVQADDRRLSESSDLTTALDERSRDSRSGYGR